MAVWLVGGTVAFVIYVGQYDVYSDSGRYSEYSAHSDYSDAAERRRRRIAALEQETESASRELSDYKSGVVNPKLSNPVLKNAPAMTVSETAMDEDANRKIDQEMRQRVSRDTAGVSAQLEEINRLIERIYQIEKEEKG